MLHLYDSERPGPQNAGPVFFLVKMDDAEGVLADVLRGWPRALYHMDVYVCI